MRLERLDADSRLYRGVAGFGLAAVTAMAASEGDLRSRALGTVISVFSAYLQTEALTGEAPVENIIYRLQKRMRQGTEIKA